MRYSDLVTTPSTLSDALLLRRLFDPAQRRQSAYSAAEIGMRWCRIMVSCVRSNDILVDVTGLRKTLQRARSINCGLECGGAFVVRVAHLVGDRFVAQQSVTAKWAGWRSTHWLILFVPRFRDAQLPRFMQRSASFYHEFSDPNSKEGVTVCSSWSSCTVPCCQRLNE